MHLYFAHVLTSAIIAVFTCADLHRYAVTSLHRHMNDFQTIWKFLYVFYINYRYRYVSDILYSIFEIKLFLFLFLFLFLEHCHYDLTSEQYVHISNYL